MKNKKDCIKNSYKNIKKEKQLNFGIQFQLDNKQSWWSDMTGVTAKTEAQRSHFQLQA